MKSASTILALEDATAALVALRSARTQVGKLKASPLHRELHRTIQESIGALEAEVRELRYQVGNEVTR